MAAATALMENTQLSAREIVERSVKIAAEICIYSNTSITIEELKANELIAITFQEQFRTSSKR